MKWILKIFQKLFGFLSKKEDDEKERLRKELEYWREKYFEERIQRERLEIEKQLREEYEKKLENEREKWRKRLEKERIKRKQLEKKLEELQKKIEGLERFIEEEEEEEEEEEKELPVIDFPIGNLWRVDIESNYEPISFDIPLTEADIDIIRKMLYEMWWWGSGVYRGTYRANYIGGILKRSGDLSDEEAWTLLQLFRERYYQYHKKNIEDDFPVYATLESYVDPSDTAEKPSGYLSVMIIKL